MKFSIITPSYNQGQFIERTLRSVAAQQGADVEHLVFDGGSSDNTVDVLKSATPAVRWVSERDEGQAHAVNKGLNASDGEIIGWLNSDDIYYPDAISHIAAFFEAHPDVDVVYGKACHIDADDRVIEFYSTEPWDMKRLRTWCFICQPALFFRRSVVDRFGLLDESLRYCMDYEYWLRIGAAGAKFAFLEEVLAGSRLHPATKTLGESVEAHAEICDMLKRKLGKVPNRWLIAYANTVVERRYPKRHYPRWAAVKRATAALLAAFRWNGYATPSLVRAVFRRIARAFAGRPGENRLM